MGFPKGFNPHSGWSFITRYLQPYSKVGRFLFRKLVDINHSKPGLEAIYNSWDFKTIVMCHGNIITKDAKEAFKHVLYKSKRIEEDSQIVIVIIYVCFLKKIKEYIHEIIIIKIKRLNILNRKKWHYLNEINQL